MSYLKFYEIENERHRDLFNIPATQEETRAAIKRLTRHYFGNYDGRAQTLEQKPEGGMKWIPNPARPIEVVFEAYNTGHAWSGYKIDFPKKHTNWLLIVHEFAHIYQVRKLGKSGHTKRMARVVDWVCDYVRSKGWASESLDAAFSAWCAMQPVELPAIGLAPEVLHAPEGFVFEMPEPALRSAACPVPVDPDALADAEHELTKAAKLEDLKKRIAKREAQVKRLERRSKSIATRLKKANRSLKALQRSAARLEHP